MTWRSQHSPGIPEGKKSNIVSMPATVKELNPKERIPYIAGVVDTDWGISGNSP